MEDSSGAGRGRQAERVVRVSVAGGRATRVGSSRGPSG